ncbi:MAG: alanine racemase [Rhodothermales bacterium]
MDPRAVPYIPSTSPAILLSPPESVSHSPTIAEVDLGALRRNLATIRRRVAPRPVMAVVKANAYGHGAERVAQCLLAEGVQHFAVATLDEGIALRQAGISGNILVFGAPLPAELPWFAENELDLTVGSESILMAVLQCDTPLRVQLLVDTGMTRLGLEPQRAISALAMLGGAGHVALTGVCTHLAGADLPDRARTTAQLATWSDFLASARPVGCPVHVAASGGCWTSPEALKHSDLVRAGISLYGLYEPSGDTAPDVLEPVARLISRVARVQRIGAGTAVSYGGRWKAPYETRVATIAAGYADGVPRSLSNVGRVGIRGRLFPMVGTICMDMLMVHIDDPDFPMSEGDEVVLFGRGGPSCSEQAEKALSITYEMVCRISGRVARRYRPE